MTENIRGARGLALAILLAAGTSHAADKQALHGALAMDEQMKRLDALLGDLDPTRPPPGIDAIIWRESLPKDNEMTVERVALGRKLYFDTRLSKDGTVACATCHDVSRGFTDQRAGLRGHRRPARPAQRADHAERALLPDAVLGRPRAEPRGAGEAADPEPDRDGPAGRARRPSPAIADDAEYKRDVPGGLRPRRRTTTTSARAIAALRAHARLPRRAVRPLHRRRRERDLREGARRLGALQRQGALRDAATRSTPSNPLGTDNRFHNIGVVGAHTRTSSSSPARRSQALRAQGPGGLEAIDRWRSRPTCPSSAASSSPRTAPTSARFKTLAAAQHRHHRRRTCTTARCRRCGT